MSTAACVTDPNTGQWKASRTAMGSIGDAALCYMFAGAASGVTGFQMDKPLREPKVQTAGSAFDDSMDPHGQMALTRAPNLLSASLPKPSASATATFQPYGSVR